MKNILSVGIAMACALSISMAQENTDISLYKAGEYQIDLFAAYKADQSSPLTTSIASIASDEGDWHGGIGVNYFITKHIGVGSETYFNNFDGHFIDNTSISAFFRYPYKKVAPYGFGGVGYRFEGNDSFMYHVGLGVEYRFTKMFGLFTDMRYTWVDDDNTDHSLVRFGTRFLF